MTLEDAERQLQRDIPLAAAMGVRVVEVGPLRVLLEAPPGPNLNHHGTAFGGSLAALAVLAGWLLVRSRLDSDGPTEATAVVHRSRVAYRRPLVGRIRVIASWPPDVDWPRATSRLERRGMSRVKAVAVVKDGEDRVAAEFEGSYVLMRRSGAQGD